MRALCPLAFLPIIVAAGAAVAQDAPDEWEVHRDQRQRMVAAFLPTTTGLGIIVRCQSGAFTAYIAGLPEDRRETRTIGVAFGDDEVSDRGWTSGAEGTSAFADLPAPFARKLREGGRLQLRVPGAGEGGRTVRYVLDLPPSSAAIDETLTACERPFIDPRDAELEALGDSGLPSQIEWVAQPRPQFPFGRYGRGMAVLSCVVATDGRARDCVVETEHPHDGGFGEASLKAMRGARLRNRLNPDAAIPPSRFTFRTHYVLHGYATEEDRQRQRESDRARRERDQAE